MTTSTAHPRAATWSAEVCRNETALLRVAAQWQELHERCPEATPFQTHAWIRSWWHHYGSSGRLRLVLVRRNDQLVGAAALLMKRRWGCQVLEPLAAAQSDFSDVLLDPEHAPQAAKRMAAALMDEPGWHVLSFPEVRPSAAVGLLAAHWPRPTWRVPASMCLQLPASDVAAFLGRLPGRTASKTRARLRKIDACRLAVLPTPADQAAPAVHELLDLHIRQWRDRGINPEHMSDRFRRHLAEAVTAMIGQGQAELFQYRRDGELVAADLVLVGGDFVGGYLFGCDPGLRDRVDVSLMLVRQDLEYAVERDRPVLNFLRGAESYKLKWRPTPVRNEHLLLGRSALAAHYVAGELGRARLRDFKQRHRDGALRSCPGDRPRNSSDA
ncbi:GNAT family N-acetyltransferase [Actinomadura hibisca]|uniref:GNAT family N-acetyltransferase n=1 Tax=Actinomadura hibisca TaxID=68565 RepID=UPI00082D6FD8|nr:GNAT family N-acetyltransferase [Actinomadura hibisca]